MTTLSPLIIACLIGHTLSTITHAQRGDTICDASVISEAVEKRYSKGPLVMKGEYFRNWSHIEEPIVIHIQTRTIMGEGFVATVFYELTGDEKALVAGVAFVLDQVIEFFEDGSLIRYPATSKYGPGNNDYRYGCTTATAWNTWIGVLLPTTEYPSRYESTPEYFIDIIEHAQSIQLYENGWIVHSSTTSRKEELVILPDGSIEVWRSTSLPGAEGTHSSLERGYRWFDALAETDVLREELAVWAESPDIKSLESLVLKHVSLAEEHAKKGESEHTQDSTGNLEETDSEIVKEEAVISTE